MSVSKKTHMIPVATGIQAHEKKAEPFPHKEKRS
jgi:hypothetical protein